MESRAVVAGPVRFGRAELIPDPGRPDGWTVVVDGVSQSYVDLADPTYLRLPYPTWIAQVVDRHWPGNSAISVLHVGGGGFSLPRYVAATRPGSEQIVYELDGPLVDLVREHLELDSVPDLRVLAEDGRAGVEHTPDATADLVVLDVFRGGEGATELATVEFLREIARVLRPGGLYVTNIWDAANLGFALRATAAVREVFPRMLVIADTDVLMRRRPGNLVIAASTRDLPVPKPTSNQVRWLTSEQLADICGSADPLTEASPQVDPVPSIRSSRQP